jgi:hypothetical protein
MVKHTLDTLSPAELAGIKKSMPSDDALAKRVHIAIEIQEKQVAGTDRAFLYKAINAVEGSLEEADKLAAQLAQNYGSSMVLNYRDANGLSSACLVFNKITGYASLLSWKPEDKEACAAMVSYLNLFEALARCQGILIDAPDNKGRSLLENLLEQSDIAKMRLEVVRDNNGKIKSVKPSENGVILTEIMLNSGAKFDINPSIYNIVKRSIPSEPSTAAASTASLAATDQKHSDDKSVAQQSKSYKQANKYTEKEARHILKILQWHAVGLGSPSAALAPQQKPTQTIATPVASASTVQQTAEASTSLSATGEPMPAANYAEKTLPPSGKGGPGLG